MFEQIVLGMIQGITEWIPISSKTCVILAKIHLFKSHASANELLSYALFLHLGTFFAAVIYFWQDIVEIIKAIASPQKPSSDGRKILIFLLVTTILTGLGWILNHKLAAITQSFPRAQVALMSVIAGLLIVTGFLQIKTKTTGKRTPTDLTIKDGLFAGLAQALATLPGMSRAGTTMATLAFLNFDKEYTLKLSFLMSLPVILVANILMNYKAFLTLGIEWIGVATSFVVGILSIRAIMAFARRINFGGFLIFIGTLLAIAIMIRAID
ncbi:MAG: undecaprenyl-diphosphate phosphatase [Candidatus Omnitrophica bacterium]|nr:undecaprenyl-diphosphate phosphatase [Candidatus Omnitrophota bacterium]